MDVDINLIEKPIFETSWLHDEQHVDDNECHERDVVQGAIELDK